MTRFLPISSSSRFSRRISDALLLDKAYRWNDYCYIYPAFSHFRPANVFFPEKTYTMYTNENMIGGHFLDIVMINCKKYR